MTDETAPDAPPAAKRPLWQRLLKWLGILVAGLVGLVAVILLGINTDPGRRFVADQLGNYTTASGLNIKVGRIDGSLYGKMVLSDLRVSDPKGVFLTSPKLSIDWRPFAYVHNHIDVRSLIAQRVDLLRKPQLKPSPPTTKNEPLLPDIDIDIGHLVIDRFAIGAPVTGQPHLLKLNGSVHIADRRAQVNADAVALVGPGIKGGDKLHLVLDAVPDDNRLALDARLFAPANGVVATIAGLKQPLTATIGGHGDWTHWQGRAVATLGGDQLAGLGLEARSGRIMVRGFARPGLYLPGGAVEHLTAPRLDVAIDTTLGQRLADTRIKLKSDAVAIDAGGKLDFANSRFGNFAVDAQLLMPGAIAPNIKGRDVAARLVLNGAFATPTVDYKIRATSIGFGDLGADQLYAEGQARVDADRILLPVHARARRITGLNAAVGGLANHVRIDGDFAVSLPAILSDNLKIRSDNIDATAIVVANIKTGRYTGALKGRINNFRVDSIGILNLTTDAKLVPGRNGGFGIEGRVVAQTSRIFNDGARSFLGGNAVVRADVGYSPDGIVGFRNLRLNAPRFKVTGGEGRYDPRNGAVAVSADAYSTQYGPLSARVTGSATNPVVILKAAKPGLGVGLANLDAHIVGRNGAYQVNATGDTQYGPFTADVLVSTGTQLSVDVHRLLFAGIIASGQVRQTATGPFAGQLQFGGRGLNGHVRLAAQGSYQRADVTARAYNATLPGPVDFTIGRAIVDASVVLYPKAPQVVADIQLGDTRYGPTVIQAARAKVNYTNGSGTAQALVTGSNGVAFRVALNARLSPGAYLAALQGQANGIEFRTAAPARVTQSGGTYRLAPTRIDFGGAKGGSIRLAGQYGSGMQVKARLDRLDVTLLNAFVPNLGIAGQASGSLDYAQASSGAFPQADARLTVTDFTRSGIAAVSEPVDIVFAGRLVADGGEARALVRRGSTVVGRLVATLRPLPPGDGSWVARLMQAPLSGGIRYNGPAGVLFSLAALADQQVTGPIAIAADFGGRVAAPQLTGLVRADNLSYDNEKYGTRLTQMRIAGRFTNDRFQLDQLNAKAGDGTVQAHGSVSLAKDNSYAIDMTATLNNARLASSDALAATSSGTIHVTNGPQGGLVQGDLNITNARYEVIRQGQAEVPELTGVRRKSQIVPGRPTDRPKPQPTSTFRLDLTIHADNQLYVSGMGLESEWSMKMHIGGTTADPRITGGLDLVRGTYSFAGKRFDLNRGRIQFQGGATVDPTLDIQATTTTNGITAVINIAGTGQHPQISFTSTPALPQDEVLSRLLFGTNPANLSATEALQLAAALNSLRGSGGGLNPLGKLRSAVGFDRLRILGADQATGRGTSLAAGKYITNNVYIEIVTDAKGYTATQLEISLTKALSLLSSAGSAGGTNASLRYSKDY